MNKVVLHKPKTSAKFGVTFPANVPLNYSEDLKSVEHPTKTNVYIKVTAKEYRPAMGLERYPEFSALVTKLSNELCHKINAEAWKVKSDMPYKAQFVLEEIIANLEKRV